MKQGAGAAVAIFAGVLVVTGGVGWLLYEAGDETAPPPAKSSPPAPTRGGRAHSEPPAVDPAEFQGPLPPHVRVKPPPPDAAPRLPIEGHDDLKLRNWKEIAAAYEDMRSAMLEMTEKGPPRPDEPERMESMQKRMQRFMSAAIMRPHGLDATKRFTQIDQPAFAVNLVASVLERANLPLTDAQSKRLSDLATKNGPLVDAADAELAKEDASDWMLNRVVARAAVADGFYSEMFAALTPAQAQAVTPTDQRGRMRLDMLSSAGTWGRIGRPLIFSDEKQLVDAVTNGIANQFGVVDRIAEVRPLVETWVRQGAFDAADALDVKGFTRAAHVPPAVPRMIELLTGVIDALKLPAEAAETARRSSQAYVPLRQ